MSRAHDLVGSPAFAIGIFPFVALVRCDAMTLEKGS